MKELSRIIESELKDFRSAINQGKEDPREYKKQSGNIYKPTSARFKLVVWFLDGNTRYFYSYDNIHEKNNVIIDEWNSLKKLIRLLKQFEGKYKNAIIYATLDPEKSSNSDFNYEIIKRDRYGNEKTNKFVNFTTLNQNNLLDFKKMEVYGQKKIA
jgi:hypothetical protein